LQNDYNTLIDLIVRVSEEYTDIAQKRLVIDLVNEIYPSETGEDLRQAVSFAEGLYASRIYGIKEAMFTLLGEQLARAIIEEALATVDARAESNA
jgi:hypothetical protein